MKTQIKRFPDSVQVWHNDGFYVFNNLLAQKGIFNREDWIEDVRETMNQKIDEDTMELILQAISRYDSSYFNEN